MTRSTTASTAADPTASPGSGSAALSGCAAAVEQYFRGIEAELDRIAALLTEVFAGGPVTAAAATDAIEAHVRHHLRTSSVIGAGYVAAPGALVDRTRHLAWWQGEDERLLAHDDASEESEFDYTRNEWFRAPMTSLRPHLTGPYVDLVCSDEYVVTVTAPVVVGGVVIGVVGSDTLVETLEAQFLDVLRAVHGTLVNGHGRAILSADPHVATGDLIDPGRTTGHTACGHLPVTLVVLPSVATGP